MNRGSVSAAGVRVERVEQHRLAGVGADREGVEEVRGVGQPEPAGTRRRSRTVRLAWRGRHALGAAGGAGGVEDLRRIAGGDRHVRHRPGRGRPGLEIGAGLQHGGRAAVLDDELRLVVGEPVGDRHGHAAGALHAEVRHRVLDPVPAAEAQHHPVAGAHAAREQPTRDRAGPLLPLREGQRPPRGGQRRGPVGVGRRARGEQRGHRQCRRGTGSRHRALRQADRDATRPPGALTVKKPYYLTPDPRRPPTRLPRPASPRPAHQSRSRRSRGGRLRRRRKRPDHAGARRGGVGGSESTVFEAAGAVVQAGEVAVGRAVDPAPAVAGRPAQRRSAAVAAAVRSAAGRSAMSAPWLPPATDEPQRVAGARHRGGTARRPTGRSAP